MKSTKIHQKKITCKYQSHLLLFRVQKKLSSFSSILESLHMKHDGDLYQFMQKHKEIKFKTSDIVYKIPYLDAIMEYSNNFKNAVFKVDYKDINTIQPRDPVFEIIYGECLVSAKNGKTTHSGKDPYNVKLLTEEPERKRTDKIRNYNINIKNKGNLISEHSLEFESNFECGNLHSALKMSNNEYHLFLYPDTNTGGHTQWFYFKVWGMLKRIDYTFKIMNFNKKHSAFQKGMNPWVFSLKTWENLNRGWDVTDTFNVDYCWNPFNKAVNITMKNNFERKITKLNKGENKSKTNKSTQNSNAKKLYALAFDYKWKYEEDEVYFAFSIPYSYSQCLTFIENVVEKMPLVCNKEIIYMKKELWKTLGGRSVNILKITNKSHKNSEKKQSVIIMARCHPGETVGSFVMEGVLKYLLK